MISFPFDSFTECDDASAVCTISFDKIADKRIFLLQSATIEVKGMFFDFVQHHDDRRVSAETGDELQPVVGIRVFAALAAVEHQQVQAALREEKLVGRMADLLPPEIP